jgi:hypothetical protein
MVTKMVANRDHVRCLWKKLGPRAVGLETIGLLLQRPRSELCQYLTLCSAANGAGDVLRI